MNYLNPDTLEPGNSDNLHLVVKSTHTGSMQTTVIGLQDRKPPTYVELKLRCELLEAQAVIQHKAMGDMSKEIISLNNELNSILSQLREMK